MEPEAPGAGRRRLPFAHGDRRWRERGDALHHRGGDDQDVVDADDLSIWRGSPAASRPARLLHGSANAIGGTRRGDQAQVARERRCLRFPAPSRDHVRARRESRNNRTGATHLRLPTRRESGRGSGVLAGSVLSERARDTRPSGPAYEAARRRAARILTPPRRRRGSASSPARSSTVACTYSHCYRADEILMLIRVSQHYGFRSGRCSVLEGLQGRVGDGAGGRRRLDPSATGGPTRWRPMTRSAERCIDDRSGSRVLDQFGQRGDGAPSLHGSGKSVRYAMGWIPWRRSRS